MLFTSPAFVFAFLPLSVLIYYFLLGSPWKNLGGLFICASSLLFYAWDAPEYLLVILVSICVNFLVGRALEKTKLRSLLILGVILNLAWLGYFKYTNFSIWLANRFLGSDWAYLDLMLPIGISFFTFQQIAWLVDIYSRGASAEKVSFINYCCFITFFPQLMAGPIVHHGEMMPQFEKAARGTTDWTHIFNGLVLFSVGLAKKCLLADNLAPIVQTCFESVPSLTFVEALLASLCYTFQLYFDFSGYCDMALGCALLFNIELPINFNSPYKSASIREFWHRWHITLSRWLRDYLYIPLGGNRRGEWRTGANLFATFLLGGLWHGAAWTFVLWGGLHGVAITVHRLWRRMGFELPRLMGLLLTFAFINLSWIVFRVPNRERLGKFVDAFLGYNGFGLRSDLFAERLKDALPLHSPLLGLLLMLTCFVLIFFSPNSGDILSWPDPLKLILAIILSFICFIYIMLPAGHPPFIYSQF